jgi:Nitrogen permease regulator 2
METNSVDSTQLAVPSLETISISPAAKQKISDVSPMMRTEIRDGPNQSTLIDAETATDKAGNTETHAHLPSPRPPSQCPLLCCFYAEFDIKVGPKICFQSPANFMEQDIHLPVQELEKMLATVFSGRSPSQHATPVASSRKTTPQNASAEQQEQSSIFNSCSEFIITGNELTGNIVNLSIHHIHLLTRPTMIADEKYERNSLLFCVGFCLRRTEDPRPFRPILNRLAITLRNMEVESQFLSKSRCDLPDLLQSILISLNSDARECNLLLGKADVLNLKLFRPPRMAAMPVKDFAVPILLRRDWQVQTVRIVLFCWLASSGLHTKMEDSRLTSSFLYSVRLGLVDQLGFAPCKDVLLAGKAHDQ